MKCLSAGAVIVLSSIPVLATNLRQGKSSKSIKEWRIFSKATKQNDGYKVVGAKSTSSKSTKLWYSGKSTLGGTPCGNLWHRSLSELNPQSCTNDDRIPNDPSKLYSTVQG